MNEMLKYVHKVYNFIVKEVEAISGLSVVSFNNKHRNSHWKCSVKKVFLKV